MRSRKKGRMGEAAACDYLEKQGCEILARNFTVRGGEIDIVFRDAQTLVFAEVKYRTTSRFGSPAESVTPVKMRRLTTAALSYLAQHGGPDTQCRFDVIEIAGAEKTVRHIQNAFDAHY